MAALRRTFREWTVVVFPTLLVIGYGLLLAWPVTTRAAQQSLRENHAVELITFATLFAGALLAAWIGWRRRRGGSPWWVGGFFALFGFGLFLAAMEEIAWGQWFFGFETPDFIRKLNRQNEVTLHNIKGLHNKTEYLRLAFGVGGLFGIWVARFRGWSAVAVPRLLLAWFLWIAILAGLDLHNDFYDIHRVFDYIVHRLSEVVEMMVGIAAVLYLSSKFRER